MEQKNLILGFDFGEKYSQFCCYDRGTHTAVSIPVKEGEEAVEFPTAIAKKRNEETWKTGPDAEKSAHAENGIWLDNLYESAWDPASARSKTGITRREKSLARSFAKH